MPLIWNGENSEISRRGAAARLLQIMEDLESAGERYCVIGHSHGGSIAAHALHLAAVKREKLPHLMCCITVATPFIKFIKSGWLFFRSSLLEKAALVSVATFAFLFFCFILSGGGPYFDFSWRGIFLYTLLIGPFLALYLSMRHVNGRRFEIYQPATLNFLERNFASRLLSVRHESDEAINALGALRRLHISFFDRSFAVPVLSLMSLAVIPLASLLLTQSAVFMSMIGASEWGVPGTTSSWLENVGQVITNAAAALGTGFYRFLEWTGTSFRPPGDDPLVVSLVLVAVVGPFVLSIASLAVTMASVAVAKSLSSGVSHILNPLTWAQLRKSAFGNDTLGELAPDAAHSASWSSAASAVLPLDLAQEIAKLSNTAAPNTIEKLRSGINRLILSTEKEAKQIFFHEYISWAVLIHTRYFDSERFCALLAYMIARMDASNSNIVFGAHPEREVLSRWYDELFSAPRPTT
jgi:hypothetical protein